MNLPKSPIVAVTGLLIPAVAVAAPSDLIQTGPTATTVEANVPFMQAPGGEFVGTYNDLTDTLNLSGDLNAFIEGVGDVARAEAFVALEPIDFFPVQVTPVVEADFKGVVSGAFQASNLNQQFGWFFGIYERGTFDPTNPSDSDLGEIVYGRAESFVQVGNGLQFADDLVADPFILAPTQEYVLRANVSTSAILYNAPGNETIVATIEAGGLSGFGGLTVALNPTQVPEPTSMLAVAGAGMLMLRRRRV